VTDEGLPRNPLDFPRWPDPDGAQGQKTEDALLERYKSRLAEVGIRRGQFSTASHESQVAIENAQLDVIKGSLERSRDSAKTIQTAATGISTLYTGLGALVFSVGSDKPLPLRGVIPVIFLGAAIVCSTLFLAWLGPAAKVRPFPDNIDAIAIRVERVKWLNDWVSLSVLKNVWSLRLATLYLAAGLIFLPAAFIPLSTLTASTTPVATSAPTSEGAAVKAAAPATTSTIQWPAPPEGGDTRLNQVLYRAQVSEAAAARSEAAKKGTAKSGGGFSLDEWVIWLAAAIVLATATGTVAYQNKFGDLHTAIAGLTYQPPPA
jgi:hypothetical protein